MNGFALPVRVFALGCDHGLSNPNLADHGLSFRLIYPWDLGNLFLCRPHDLGSLSLEGHGRLSPAHLQTLSGPEEAHDLERRAGARPCCDTRSHWCCGRRAEWLRTKQMGVSRETSEGIGPVEGTADRLDRAESETTSIILTPTG